MLWTNHLHFNYFLWENSLWYTSVLDYKHVSRTDYARNPRFYCIVNVMLVDRDWSCLLSRLRKYSVIVLPGPDYSTTNIRRMSLIVRYMCQRQLTAAISGPTRSIINWYYRALRCVQKSKSRSGWTAGQCVWRMVGVVSQLCHVTKALS